MYVFVRRFSIFSVKSFVILSLVTQLLEGQQVLGTRQVEFPKIEIPVSPDSEALNTAQFSRIHSKTKEKNAVFQTFMFDTCPLETVLFSPFLHSQLSITETKSIQLLENALLKLVHTVKTRISLLIRVT